MSRILRVMILGKEYMVPPQNLWVVEREAV
jgi:hypothetical protein